MTGSEKERTIPPSQRKAQNNILKVLAEFHAVGIHDLDKKLLALCCGFTSTGGHSFSYGVSYLVEKGLITTGGGRLRLTRRGIDSVERVDPPSSNEELHERILRVFIKNVDKFPKWDKASKIFQVYADGKAHSKKEAASRCGYTCHWSGPLCTFFATFNKFNFLVACGGGDGGVVKLADCLFPFDKPTKTKTGPKDDRNANASTTKPSSAVKTGAPIPSQHHNAKRSPPTAAASTLAKPGSDNIHSANDDDDDKTENPRAAKKIKKEQIEDEHIPSVVTWTSAPLRVVSGSGSVHDSKQANQTKVATISTGQQGDPILIDSDDDDDDDVGVVEADPPEARQSLKEEPEVVFSSFQAPLQEERNIETPEVVSSSSTSPMDELDTNEPPGSSKAAVARTTVAIKEETVPTTNHDSADRDDASKAASTGQQTRGEPSKAPLVKREVQTAPSPPSSSSLVDDGARQKIYKALVELRAVGVTSMSLQSAALFAELGDDPKSPAFLATLHKMERDNVIAAFDEGGTTGTVRMANIPGSLSGTKLELLENEYLHQQLLVRLVQGESNCTLPNEREQLKTMFLYLCDRQIHTEVSVARAGNCTCLHSGLFCTFANTLAQIGLLEDGGGPLSGTNDDGGGGGEYMPGRMQLAEEAFPMGRPASRLACTCLLCVQLQDDESQVGGT